MAAECPDPLSEEDVASRFPTLLALLAAFVAPPALAGSAPNHFRSFSFGLSGGFQTWSLSGLEETLGDRAAILARDGYQLEAGDFPTTFSYGAEMQFRLTERVFLRTQVEWTRLKFDDRDLRSIAALGSRARTPFSVGYESKVRSKPLLFAVGTGAAQEFRAVRVALSGNALIAPVELQEDVTIALRENETDTRVTASGTGLGFELQASIDYFTEVHTTVFIDAFWRNGSTTVSLDNAVWESSSFPGKRRIDFDGIGIRIGMRWI